ncbi:sensor domain-containing diguanylate cyclase [Lacticaseibacillus porcinae]|uniref:GGDEF domain-containing protein n=1 Tax=Lacticaseibacillus porcinae TaxID=1123687 RepID=UPI000F78CFEB|nr:GGDEF domain-containing protein [Lacticaseibacillus porcinae]
MIRISIATLFLVVVATLGFISVYAQIETGTKLRLAKNRSLSAFEQRLPQVIYICSMLVLLRIVNSATTDWLFWVMVNLQLIIMMYSNLLVTNLADFVVIQAVGVTMFATDGGMNWLTTPAYLLGCLAVYGERWYGKRLKQHEFLYLLPPIIIGGFFWGVVLLSRKALTPSLAIVNFIGFAWAYFALWDFDHYQRRDQQVIAKLTREVQYDGLTRARNWTMFQRDFNHAYLQSQDGPMALIALDLDHFKHINDHYGHLIGNQALMAVSQTVQAYLQAENAGYQFYRTGGEEFAIILPGATEQESTAIVKACQQRIRKASVHGSFGEFHLSASFGLALAKPSDGNATAMFKRADHYLYQAKRAGRDCITIEGEALEEASA